MLVEGVPRQLIGAADPAARGLKLDADAVAPIEVVVAVEQDVQPIGGKEGAPLGIPQLAAQIVCQVPPPVVALVEGILVDQTE